MATIILITDSFCFSTITFFFQSQSIFFFCDSDYTTSCVRQNEFMFLQAQECEVRTGTSKTDKMNSYNAIQNYTKRRTGFQLFSQWVHYTIQH